VICIHSEGIAGENAARTSDVYMHALTSRELKRTMERSSNIPLFFFTTYQ
jgi:hypothetical protein